MLLHGSGFGSQDKDKQQNSGEGSGGSSIQHVGSTMLFMHYSDKLNELTQVIKSGFRYIEDCKEQSMQIDECLICGDNFEDMDNVEHEEEWFRDLIPDDKTKHRLECGHQTFHKQCILKWLRVKPHCPLCNKRIEEYC